MKMLDLLVKNLNQWPNGKVEYFNQDKNGEFRESRGVKYDFFAENNELADETQAQSGSVGDLCGGHRVYRAEYEAAKAKLSEENA
jgi:hypothetical protein